MGMFLRLIAGEVEAEKLQEFNFIRQFLIRKDKKYERFVGTKSKAIRTFINIMNTYPLDVINLAEKAERGENNAVAEEAYEEVIGKSGKEAESA